MADIKEIAEQELERQGENTEIIAIYEVGSQLFKSDPNDLDFVVICEEYSQKRKKFFTTIEGIDYDIAFFDEDSMKGILDYSNTDLDEGYKIFNYWPHIATAVYGSWDYGFNILDHQDLAIHFLKNNYNRGLVRKINKTRITKSYVHYYLPLKMFENNSTEITSEMHQDVVKLYEEGDQVLPIVEWIEDQLSDI